MPALRSAQTFWLGVTVAYMAVIIMSSLQSQIIPGEPALWKKVVHNSAHIPAYMLLTFLFWQSFNQKFLKWAAFAAFAYGLVNEGVQMHVPGRMASAGDLCLNAGGIVLAYVLIKNFLERKQA